jgi:hypothetical protein
LLKVSAVNHGRTVFAQLVDFLPRYEFDQCVARYGGNRRIRALPTYEQFLILAFAQLTYRESLRDIESCLEALGPRLYHSGLRTAPARSTLADANERRDWRIFADFAQVLIREAARLYANEPFGAELQQTAYALDSTTIDLCLSLFPWAGFRKTKAAVKLHTLLALRGNYPAVVIVTTGRVHDVNILDQLSFEAGSFYIVDRGYLDFGRLFRLGQAGAFYVTRARKDFCYKVRARRPVDRATGLRADQTVALVGFYTRKSHPTLLRRVVYLDRASGKSLVFLTNNFAVPALSVADLYRCRWQVELFFKWIKQHLRIKAFYGTSENAVRIQVWTALAVYVLVAIVRKQLKLQNSLHSMLQILSLTLFEKTPRFVELFSDSSSGPKPNITSEPCLPGF